MIKHLFLAKNIVIKFNKKNPVVKELFTKKFKNKKVKPKKGKVVFKRVKKNKLIFNIYVKTNNYSIFFRFIFCNFVGQVSWKK